MRHYFTYSIHNFILYGLGVWFPCILIIGLLGAGSRVGSSGIGILFSWQAARNCAEVHALTPSTWLPIRERLLQPGDCILTIANMRLGSTDLDSYLQTMVDKPLHERFVPVVINRNDQLHQIFVPVIRKTWVDIAQSLLAIFSVGISFWILGIIALIANRHTSENRVFATLAFLGSLYIIGATHQLPDGIGRIYTSTTFILSQSLLGCTLFHFGMVFPQRNISRLSLILTYSIYCLGISVLVIHEIVLLYIASGQWWIPKMARLSNNISVMLIVLGLANVLIQWVHLWKNHTIPYYERINMQLRIMILAWGIGLLPIAIAILAYQLTGRAWWPFVGTSGLVLLLIPLIASTGTAFAMFKYQILSYQKTRLLTISMILFVSSAIAFLILFMMSAIAIFRIDGIWFSSIWFSTIMTSSFWYMRTPLREGFEKYFLRHQDDQEILQAFTSIITWGKDRKSIIKDAIEFLVQRLKVTHASIQLNKYTLPLPEQILFIEIPPLYETYSLINNNQPHHSILNIDLYIRDQCIGTLSIGSYISTIPFDYHDHLLMTFIGHYLSWILTVESQQNLSEEMIRRITFAVDTAYETISDTFHTEVINGFALVAKDLERIEERMLINPQKAHEKIQQVHEFLLAHIIKLRNFQTQSDMFIPKNLEHSFLQELYTLFNRLCKEQHITPIWNLACDKQFILEKLTNSTKITLFRIARQAIRNATMHAHASQISVSFETEGTNLLMSINDNGIGFDHTDIEQKTEGHIGMMWMYERTLFINGKFILDSVKGRGTTITVRLEIR